jgi:ABC-type amino acid transport substrate-binding protein
MTAAQACGINRSTVLRAIKSGKISATKDELTGAWLIEPAELHRLYPPVAAPEANAVAVPKDATPDALVAELRAQLAEMRQQRDAWQGIAERLALPKPQAPPPARWRWFRRATA